MGIDAEMYVLVDREQATEEKLREAAHWLFAYFGPEKFLTYSGPILEAKDTVVQDGPDDVAPEGKTFVHVHVWTRYYGEGYERGDLPFLYLLARALEHRFPGGKVLYGGDSTGVLAEPFGHEQREDLLAHWLGVARKPYHEHFDAMGDDHPICRQCLVPMVQYGFGQRYALYSCYCGERHETRDGKTTVQSHREQEEAQRQAKRRVLALVEEHAPGLAKDARLALWGRD